MRVLKNLSFLLILFFNSSLLSAQRTNIENPFLSALNGPELRFIPLKFQLESIGQINANSIVYKVDIGQWPIFCKLEEKWRKKYVLPAKFRLGSVNYVDFLENK